MSAHFERGRILYIQHRYSDAEREFRKALAETPQDSTTHAMLACSLDAQRKHGDAIREAKEAIKLDPENAFAYYALTLPSLKSNRLKEAKSAIRQALKLNPVQPLFYSTAAFIADCENDWPAMLKVAEQGLANDPEHVDCINARAKALTHMGRTEEAAVSLQHALQIDPENSDTHANMGWLLVRRGSVSEAVDHFREALRIDPNSKWAYEGVVEALKARNPIYHSMLEIGLWFSSLSTSMQTGLYWVVWIIPPARAFLLVSLLGYFCAHTFFNFLLRLDPVGRRVLTDQAKKQNNYALGGVALIVGLVWFCWYSEVDNPDYRALHKASSLVKIGRVGEARKIWQQQFQKANSLIADEEYSDAERVLERLDSHLKTLQGREIAGLRIACSTALGRLYLRQKLYYRAQPYFERAAEVAKEASDPVAEARSGADLGLTFLLQEQYEKSLHAYEAALAALKKAALDKTDDYDRIARDYACVLRKTGRGEQADVLLASTAASRTPQQYVQAVQFRIKAAWRPPRANHDSDIVASFRVNADGSVKDVKLVKSSPLVEANAQAVAAINAAAPFDPLPETLKPVAQIQFTFHHDASRLPKSRPR